MLKDKHILKKPRPVKFRKGMGLYWRVHNGPKVYIGHWALGRLFFECSLHTPSRRRDSRVRQQLCVPATDKEYFMAVLGKNVNKNKDLAETEFHSYR